MKIPFVISVKNTEEREIDLPYFCRLKDRFYKVVSEDISIQVDPSPTYTLANKCGTWLVKTEVGEATPCTEQEFNEAYHKALFEIGKYVPAPPVPGELIEEETINTEAVNQ